MPVISELKNVVYFHVQHAHAVFTAVRFLLPYTALNFLSTFEEVVIRTCLSVRPPVRIFMTETPNIFQKKKPAVG